MEGLTKTTMTSPKLVSNRVVRVKLKLWVIVARLMSCIVSLLFGALMVTMLKDGILNRDSPQFVSGMLFGGMSFALVYVILISYRRIRINPETGIITAEFWGIRKKTLKWVRRDIKGYGLTQTTHKIFTRETILIRHRSDRSLEIPSFHTRNYAEIKSTLAGLYREVKY